ncbi:MAG: sulfate transporter CysZ [Gammaproteobacteria bacterium]
MNNYPTTGFQYLSDGFKLIFKPGLKRFVIIPLIINTCLFVSLFYLTRHFFNEFDLWVEGHLPSWLKWLGQILWLVFFSGFLLVMIYTFVTVANLISAPFNSFLAEKVELYLTGNTLEQKSWREVLADVPRVIGRQLAILGYYLPRAIFLLLCFFIPIVQFFAAFLWFLFNAWFMTLQFLDYPTDNHKVPLRDVHAWTWQNRLLSLSFGSSILILTMIPGLNFFVAPAAVAGATKLWVNEMKNKTSLKNL